MVMRLYSGAFLCFVSSSACDLTPAPFVVREFIVPRPGGGVFQRRVSAACVSGRRAHSKLVVR